MQNSKPTQDVPVDVNELQRLVSAAAPAALLAPPWLMRRIIKADRGIGGIFFEVPHRKTYCISREALLAITTPEELGVKPDQVLPDQLMLLSCSAAWLAGQTRPMALVHFWRLLFHASIDRHFKLNSCESSYKDLIGPVEMEEAARVLRSENYLLPPVDDASCFAEFVAVYLELRYFDPALLACTFPALADDEEDSRRGAGLGPCPAQRLAELVHADALFAGTRLAGAPDPLVEQDRLEPGLQQPIVAVQALAGLAGQAMLAEAAAAQRKGNLVRAAIVRMRSASPSPEAALQAATQDLDRLATRLQAALSMSDEVAQAWRTALPALLGPASQGIWPPAARLLYDLQKVCTDFERETFAVDLVEWVCSLGRKAIVRPLPLRAGALRVKHLRTAYARLAKVHGSARHDLGGLLEDAIEHSEEKLRAKIRPLIAGTFDEVGFTPVNVPETLARDNIIEELLDLIGERGFINMGDLRDAISRNQLKIPDASPLRVLLGDQLLQANRRLAICLDGVYRRGEIYLRWLQRLSSILFGNWLGRWIVLFLILPFGGALATAVFAQEIAHLAHVRFHIRGIRESAAPALLEPLADGHHQAGSRRHHDEHGLSIDVRWQEALAGLFILGTFYLLLLHVGPFRLAVWSGLKLLWSILRGIFYDGPLWTVELPPVRAFLESRPMLLFRRYLLRPVVAGLAALLLSLWFDIPGPWDNLGVSLAVFGLGLLFFNTPLARHIEEAITHWVSSNWTTLLYLLAGIVGWFLDFFKIVLDRIERLIYAVDEWLRFHKGDGRFSFAGKLVLGLIWFFATYVIRIVIHLFIEPTVNPVKHFPAVTVGAKLLIPIYQTILETVPAALEPFMGLALAGAVAGGVILLLPGIFGFAVWEFKENWKLYQANRAKTLRPVAIGHHGETMVRLLRPGFHSGTVPKALSKLRRAMRDRNARKIHRQRDNLHHVSEAVRRFAERELAALLKLCKSWSGLTLTVGKVNLATNRIRLRLHVVGDAAGAANSTPLVVSFVERAGSLQAVMDCPGWLDRLTPAQSAAFRTALAGWQQLAGVEPGAACPAITWAGWVAAWEQDRRGLPPVIVRQDEKSAGS